MTQRNIDTMDIIVNKIAEGEKFSKVLESVYSKRNVCLPYNEDDFNISIMSLGMTSRDKNALLRANIITLSEVIDFCNNNKITEVSNCGKTSGIEIFETILDYYWKHLDDSKRTAFLIDIVERNSDNIRAEIA